MSAAALGAAALVAAAGAGPVSAAKVSPPTAKRSFVAHIVQATTARAEPRAGARAVGRVRTSAP